MLALKAKERRNKFLKQKLFFYNYSIGFLPWITRNNTAMIANTNNK